MRDDDLTFGLNLRPPDSVTKQVHLDDSPDDSGVVSRPFTLESMLSGDTYTASTETIPHVTGSTELSLNYEDLHNLALFGSVYTRVTIAVERVQSEYPNGFIISQLTSGVT